MRSPADILLQPLERQRLWYWEDIPVLELRLSLPHCLSQDRRVCRINRYYEHFAKSCEQYADRVLYPTAAESFAAALQEHRCGEPWQFCVEFSTRLLSDKIWSLTVETAESTNRPPYRCRYADTWDLNHGCPLSLSELFPVKSLHRRLRQHTREVLSARQAQGAVLRENWRQQLGSAWNRENFYLSGEGLHWFYPMYTLGGETLGIPEFFLPRDNSLLPLSLLDNGLSSDIR